MEDACALLQNTTDYNHIRDEVMTELVAKLKETDEDEKIFYDFVTDEIAPDYSEVIKEPICLNAIEAKVKDRQYMGLEALKKDVRCSLFFHLFLVSLKTCNKTL